MSAAPHKRHRGVVALAAATTTTAAIAGVMLLTNSDEDAPADGRRPKAPPATTQITRTDLVRSKTVDGRLDYAQRRAVKSPVAGTLTKAAEPGRTLSPGQRLYERDARPVVLLYGSTPMFRAMKVGDHGPDVLQLERNLRELGFGPRLSADTRYDEATKAAVKAWQKSLGIVDANGEIGRGDIVFQPGPVRVISADAALADTVGPDSTVLTIASTQPVVRASLDKADRALAARGTKVDVTLPSGGTVRGKVSGTAAPGGSASAGQETAAGSGTAPSQDGGVEVEITLDDGGTLRPKDQQGTLSVKFVSERRKNVLTVPVEAVVALREGGYGLQVVQGTGTHLVRIQTGLTADGRIEISGTGVTEGTKVGAAEQ